MGDSQGDNFVWSFLLWKKWLILPQGSEFSEVLPPWEADDGVSCLKNPRVGYGFPGSRSQGSTAAASNAAALEVGHKKCPF